MSRRFVTIGVTLVVFLAFLLFMSTFTVRFSERAVVTTFDRASENSVVERAGLGFKWPYPVQSVKVYDTRARLLQLQSETQQTEDDRQVVVEAFLTWNVVDPLLFYQRFGGAGSEEREHYREAESNIRALFRSAMSEIGRYRLTELFAPGADSKLPELEQRILDRLDLDTYGVRAHVVGIDQIVLPEETTTQVFQRMKAARERLAAEASSQGKSLASTIRFEAEAAAQRIRAFAERRAEQIRVLGDAEAARWQARLAEEPELATFDAQLRFLRNLYAKRTTIVIPTTQPGMGVLDPQKLESAASTGALPPFAAEPPEPETATTNASDRGKRAVQ